MFGLIQFLPVVFAFLVVVVIARNVLRLTQKLGDAASPLPRAPEAYDPALAERTRRVQAEIRRKIAERRGIPMPPAGSFEPLSEPPVTFLEPPVETVVAAATSAVLERQQQLADQMRSLEVARATQQRRVAQAASTVKSAAESESGMLLGARGQLLADLREPGSVRRAIVLREVLGTPVGLR